MPNLSVMAAHFVCLLVVTASTWWTAGIGVDGYKVEGDTSWNICACGVIDGFGENGAEDKIVGLEEGPPKLMVKDGNGGMDSWDVGVAGVVNDSCEDIDGGAACGGGGIGRVGSLMAGISKTSAKRTTQREQTHLSYPSDLCRLPRQPA